MSAFLLDTLVRLAVRVRPPPTATETAEPASSRPYHRIVHPARAAHRRHYLERLATALEHKTGRARATSLATLIEADTALARGGEAGALLPCSGPREADESARKRLGRAAGSSDDPGAATRHRRSPRGALDRWAPTAGRGRGAPLRARSRCGKGHRPGGDSSAAAAAESRCSRPATRATASCRARGGSHLASADGRPVRRARRGCLPARALRFEGQPRGGVGDLRQPALSGPVRLLAGTVPRLLLAGRSASWG